MISVNHRKQTIIILMGVYHVLLDPNIKNLQSEILGYPQHDCLHTSERRDYHKITSDKFRKVVIWMPTFRKRIAFGREDSTAIEPHVIPIFKTMDKIQDLNGYLNINNALLIIKIHPMQDLCSI